MSNKTFVKYNVKINSINDWRMEEEGDGWESSWTKMLSELVKIDNFGRINELDFVL